ncbi:uncharacterized protein LOC144712407, partial [Wolffia australiana]
QRGNFRRPLVCELLSLDGEQGIYSTEAAFSAVGETPNISFSINDLPLSLSLPSSPSSLRKLERINQRSYTRRRKRRRRREKRPGIVASGRRLPSDSGAFADWVASSAAARGEGLRLGFNGGGGGEGAGGALWSSAAAPRLPPPLNYGLADILVVAQNPNEAILPPPPFFLDNVPDYSLPKPAGLLDPPALSSVVTCQDCGNKAKKDCAFRRCRTCCKSRGFDCATHVRSTWVSAAQRRDRQMSSGSTSTAKKPRLISAAEPGTATGSTSNTATPPRSFETASSQRANFERMPGQVTAPAVFKCVRVTNMDDGVDEFAYQAVVKISGHVFKGFLYDQGPGEDAGNDDDVAGGAIPNISELHLGGYGRGGADLYSAGIGGSVVGGTAPYGKPIN